ncbi:alpha/beta hydrolase [Undibacterium sp. TS12]|uniref:alpha/beta fold hydrolase n=1 Tax=Undibacterium sp. TS12 TaxID=2908202 RepID=UPI001F4C6AE6|nr:alpha/beta hydrolase [Undibacterium sp. TS12]MCH8619791.1 alpha/beta hydrolase [Undibacterium sp. TS12]
MQLKKWILSSLFGFYCSAALAPAAWAADDNTGTTASKAGQQFQVGSLSVERYGHQGKAIILIPGLASGSWVWQDTIRQLEKNHTLYVVTLAGFDGRPAIEGPLLEKARQSLLDLIQQQKLIKPMLIGHSMGGTLSIWFAQEHSDLISGVVAVDGLPVLPGTENAPAEQRPALAASFKAQMSAQTTEAFNKQQLQYMRTVGVIDEQLAQASAIRTSKSDPAACASYVSELVTMDLRKDMSKVQVPLLEVSPWHAPDFATRNISLEAKNSYYQSLLQGAPKLKVVGINNARHFVMLDQPKAFAEALNNFLDSVE